MAKREFGPRQAQVEAVLLQIRQMTREQALAAGNAALRKNPADLEEVLTVVKLDLTRERAQHWSNARAAASDAIRTAAYRNDGLHYTKIGDESQLPWGVARAAARDAVAAIAVADILEPRNLAFLTDPLQTIGIAIQESAKP